MRLPALAAFGLATLGAQAQVAAPPLLRHPEPVVPAATRSVAGAYTLRDAMVITRADIEAAGADSLGELLALRAGVELRALGGPGQPQGVFIRGAGPAQTLVLVDGLRVGSATTGAAAIAAIPLDMVERIEVVKGAMSALYGSDAAGGVVQVLTRGKEVPHLFASAAYGSHQDRRLAAGIATAEGDTRVALSLGARKVEAPSATNPRAGLAYAPDRDPHDHAFATLHAATRLWQGETLALEAWASRSRTRFDDGVPEGGALDDRSDQSLLGARLSSSNRFTAAWSSRLVAGHTRDELEIRGRFPARFETRRDELAWIHEFLVPGGVAVAGVEGLREAVRPARRVAADGTETILYARDEREVRSGFVTLQQAWQGQSLELAVRRDREDQMGERDSGSASYGIEWPRLGRIAATYARGYRMPSFNDLYGQSFPGFYVPNPGLRPERSESRELVLRAPRSSPVQWQVTAFDNRFRDLIVFSPGAGTVLNVDDARIRGLEARVEAAWLGVRWRASATAQRPRDQATGLRLPARAEAFGSFEAARDFGPWRASVAVLASGERFDSADASPASRLAGYAVVDARLRYAFRRHWVAELAVTNVGDRRYERALGYEAPGRGVLLSLRFEAF